MPVGNSLTNSNTNISRKDNGVKNSISGLYKKGTKAQEKGTENFLKTPEKAVRHSLKKDGNNNLYWEIESHKDIFKGLKAVWEYEKAAYPFLLQKRDAKAVVYTFGGKEVHFIRLSVKGFTHSEESKFRECIYNINLEVDQILPHTNKSASGINGSTSGVNISRKNNGVKNSISGLYKKDTKAPEKAKALLKIMKAESENYKGKQIDGQSIRNYTYKKTKR